MLVGCLEVFLTGGEIILKLLVIVFIPLFFLGILLAFSGGTIFDLAPSDPGHSLIGNVAHAGEYVPQGDVSSQEFLCCTGGAICLFGIGLIAAIRRVF